MVHILLSWLLVFDTFIRYHVIYINIIHHIKMSEAEREISYFKNTRINDYVLAVTQWEMR